MFEVDSVGLIHAASFFGQLGLRIATSISILGIRRCGGRVNSNSIMEAWITSTSYAQKINKRKNDKK